ncbi:MAG: hypothetical protein ACOY4H_01040 [Thermodesulfobacteriota bacterium]
MNKIIFEDMRAFYRVGCALIEIRERELYREEHRTFEGYCKKIFDFSRGHAYRLIGAAQVVENLSQMSPNWRQAETDPVIDMVPMNEAQVRPLVRLQPDQQREVWQAVVKNAGLRKKVTAGLVNSVVKKYLGETVTTTVRTAKERVREEQVIGAEFRDAFESFIDQLEKEIQGGYRSTSRLAIVDCLRQIGAIVNSSGSALEEPAWDGGAIDAVKLEKAGFKLFRMDKSSMHIKIRSGGGWPNHCGPYKTVKEMEEAFVELMQDQNSLRA